MSEFFLELFSEEIPPYLQKNARENLLKNFRDFFEKKNISNIIKFRQYLLDNKIYYPANGIIFLSNSTSYKNINYVLNHIKIALNLFIS